MCSHWEKESRCLSPSSILIPPCSPLPLLSQLNKDNCSLLATCPVWDLESEMCLSTDAGGSDSGPGANVCISMSSRDGGGREEIILKIMLVLVPTRSQFRASAFFRGFSIEMGECVQSWSSCLYESALPSTFSCSKTFPLFVLLLRVLQLEEQSQLFKGAMHFSCQEDEVLSMIQQPHKALFILPHHIEALYSSGLAVLL